MAAVHTFARHLSETTAYHYFRLFAHELKGLTGDVNRGVIIRAEVIEDEKIRHLPDQAGALVYGRTNRPMKIAPTSKPV